MNPFHASPDPSLPESQSGVGDIARVVNSGLPLAAGLRASAEENSSGRERAALLALADQLEAGVALDEALANQRGLPPEFTELIAAGTRSGRLAPILADYLNLQRQRYGVRQRLLVSAMYPVVVFVLVGLVSLIFPIWIAPGLRELYSDFGIELPSISLFVLSMSELIELTWPLLLLGMFGILLLPLLHEVLPGKGGRQRLLGLVPILGSSLRMAGKSEMAFLLGTLMRSRVDILDALGVMSTTLKDYTLRSGCRQLAQQLREGRPPRELFWGPNVIPADIVHVLVQNYDPEIAGEQLRMLGHVYAQQTETRLRFLFMLLEPLAIFGVVLGIGVATLSVMYPLIRLLNDLS